MADTPSQPGATTTLGYLADRSAQLAASLREVEAEILKGQGATSLADASRGSHARVARLRANLRETLQPLLDEAEGEGLRGDILKVGDAESKQMGGHNLMANHIADSEGLKKIEDLQQHDNNDIYEKAVRVLETYFGVDEEDVNVAPETIGNNFAFGVAQNTPQKAFDFGPGM